MVASYKNINLSEKDDLIKNNTLLVKNSLALSWKSEEYS